MIDGLLNIWREIKLTPLYIIFFIGSFLVVNLFMFVSIFLFHKTFYNANNIWIVLTFTLTLSIIWKAILTIIVLIKTEKRVNDDTNFDINQLAFVNGFTAIFTLTLSISIFYILKNICNKNYAYHCVLLWSFGYILFALIYSILERQILKRKEKRQQTLPN